MEAELDKARQALKTLQPAKRLARKTTQTVIEALLPDIDKAMERGVAVSDILPVVEEALGRKLPVKTFSSVLCRLRKAGKEEGNI